MKENVILFYEKDLKASNASEMNRFLKDFFIDLSK